MAKLSDWLAFPKRKYDEWHISLPSEDGQRYFLCDDGINVIGEDNRAEVARLIAAAPELLEACQVAEKTLRYLKMADGGAYQVIAAAIAKLQMKIDRRRSLVL